MTHQTMIIVGKETEKESIATKFLSSDQLLLCFSKILVTSSTRRKILKSHNLRMTMMSLVKKVRQFEVLCKFSATEERALALFGYNREHRF